MASRLGSLRKLAPAWRAQQQRPETAAAVLRARLKGERSDSGSSLGSHLGAVIPVRCDAWSSHPFGPRQGWQLHKFPVGAGGLGCGKGGFTENGLSARTPPCISHSLPRLHLARFSPEPETARESLRHTSANAALRLTLHLRFAIHFHRLRLCAFLLCRGTRRLLDSNT